MKRFVTAAAVSAAALMGTTAFTQAAEVEVIHWWTSGGEQAAVSVFAEEFEARTEHTWVDNAIALGENARAAVMQRTLGGDPPGASQFNPGRQYEELIEAGLLLDLTPLAEAENWDEILRPDATVSNCKIDGTWWCVPTNIHSEQWAWASIPAFESAGLEVPTTVQGFAEALPALEEAGVIPIAMGGDSGWQINLMGNTVLLNVLGREKWEAIIRDQDVELAAGQEVREVFELMRTFSQYSDEGSVGRNWNDTTALVLNDQAGFQIMGDWAHGEFALAGKVAGEDYACVLGPAETPYISLGGDIFVFFKQDDPAVEEAQLELASTMVSPEVQVSFNLAKGSLPVRGDVDMTAADACMQTGIPLLDDPDRIVPAMGIYRTEAFGTEMNALWADVWYNADLSIEDAQARFVDLVGNAE